MTPLSAGVNDFQQPPGRPDLPDGQGVTKPPVLRYGSSLGIGRRWLWPPDEVVGRQGELPGGTRISAAEGPTGASSRRPLSKKPISDPADRCGICRPAARPARSAAGFWVTEQLPRSVGPRGSSPPPPPQRTSEIHASQHCLPSRRAGVAGSCCRGTSLTLCPMPRSCWRDPDGRRPATTTGRNRPPDPGAAQPPFDAVVTPT